MAKQPQSKNTKRVVLPVRAKHAGLYDGHRREGEEFEIKDASDLAVWMDPVNWSPDSETEDEAG